MKDIICNAHYAPGYLYERWYNCDGKSLDVDGLVYWDIWESEETYWQRAYMIEHIQERYDSTSEFFSGFKGRELMDYGEGCITPNDPIEKYDPAARRAYEEEFEETWPYGDD